VVKIITIFGTRPEAIKMAPVVKALELVPSVTSLVCVTGQHREMLDQVLDLFQIQPAYDLNVMQPVQSLTDITCRVLQGVGEVIAKEKPDRVLVHGDTTTAMATALAAFYQKVPVGHVEAGLRTGNIYSPWPEEINRRFIDQIADLLLVPTQTAREALLREGLGDGDKEIHVTGNTVIDALLQTVARIASRRDVEQRLDDEFRFLDGAKRLVLVTMHRREIFGDGMGRICQALTELARRPDIELVYPVHLNENVKKPVHEMLGAVPSIRLTEPVEYLQFCYLMRRAHIILTDSGGVQEEAAALSKPVLVMRDVTERPEGIETGIAELVGTQTQTIVRAANRLLDDAGAYAGMAGGKNPYGDGLAAHRIVSAVCGEAAGKAVLAANDATTASANQRIGAAHGVHRSTRPLVISNVH
jgi:UDP-N-acetylglucosamine 2-epimerase (non-hydrolysing)